MSEAVDLAALAARGVSHVTLARGVEGESGHGTDYTGWSDASSVFVKAKVGLREQSRGFARIVVTVEGSSDGNSWSTLATFTFGSDGEQSASFDSPPNHLRASWAITGGSEWMIFYVDASASVVDAPGGGGGSQPVDVGAVSGEYQPCMGYRGTVASDLSWSTTTATEMGLASGHDVFVPWFVPAPVTVTALAWKVADASGVVGLYRLGLYLADASWQPTELAWDSGQQDASVETLQTAVVSLALQGRYLQAFTANDNAINNDYSLDTIGKPAIVDTGWTALETGAGPGRFARARAFGAFPDPGAAWTAKTSFADLNGVGWPLHCKLS